MSRGRIPELIADDMGNIDVMPSFLLQNLTGKDGILGRAISIQDKTDSSDLSCCTIAIDVTPEQFAAKPTYPSQGSYGGYSRSRH